MIAAGLETADKHFGMSFGLGSFVEGRNDSHKRFFSEISSNSIGMAQPCFVAPPPRSNMNMNIYSSAPKLSLTLTSSLEGKGDMFGSSGGESQLGRQRDEEYESRSGSDNMEGNGSGDEQEDNHPKKKRYHRHTPQQIQEMEALFKECPHPDEKQRQLLSKQLGLAPRQIKFWFQNRRTQMKAQHERHENSLLRQDNEKLRLENMAIKEAMRNPICTNCGGPAVIAEVSLQEQQLRIENIRLKDELERMAAMAGKFYGRPISLTSLPAMHGASLELGMGAGANSFDGLHSSLNPPSELLLLQGSSVDVQSRTGAMMGIDRSLVAELAIVAMDELMKMLQLHEPLWIRSIEDGRETLNNEEYLRQFPRGIGPKPMTHKTEATRQSGPVLMNSLDLVETLMDANRCKEMFPCILSKAATLEVISSGTGLRHGALQLMYMEMQVPSPLVPTREVNFLRFSQQHSEGVWAVVDVSVDGLRENSPASFVKYRRRPSGCLIQDLPNGYSQVTWVEHAEYDDIDVHGLYRTVVNCGLAFGAGRWLATLQRQCECLAVLMSNNVSSRDHTVIANPNGRRSMLKLAQRMTTNYCGGVSASSGQTWTKLSNGDDDVRVTTRKNTDDPGEPSGVVLSAATSVWLPVSPQRLFEFLRDATLRNKWDILSNGGQMQEMANIAKGNDPGNSVSLLGASGLNSNQSMLILQECCTDAYGSLVVYAPIDVGAMHLVMSGGDSSYISLLPSGFAIVPEGSQFRGALGVPESGRSLSSLQVGGSLLTVAFQILVSSLPHSKLTMESVETVNNLISSTVKKIKGALGVENDYD